jgi:type IV pilus assembly protein PilA
MLHTLRKLQQRARDEKGFTLIELLVVILIIGILAAIALPAFLNQRSKAQDTTAKSDARTAQTAMETYYTDNQTYATATPTLLQGIEPALNNVPTLAVSGNTAANYTVTVTSKSSDGTKFSITNTGGQVTRTCDKAGKGGCDANGKW